MKTQTELTTRIRRSNQHGFSLIELGIVIAVIAILATVVLVGRGFLESSRTSKVVEVIDTVCKGMAVYSGTNGGEVPITAGTLLTDLVNRELISNTIANSVPGFTLASVTRNNTEQFTIVINCTSAQGVTSCEDICKAKNRDDSLIACNAAAAVATLQFRL